MNKAGVVDESSIVPSVASPLTSVEVRGREFLVKRDDQWRLRGDLGAGTSGNKARKLLQFALSGPTSGAVASLGGHQSNAMVAIAALCRARGVRFLYLCKPVPRWLRKNPCGNYARGLALGVELLPLEGETYRRCILDSEFRSALLQDVVDDEADRTVTWVPQGAAFSGAEYGVSLLARELEEAFPDDKNFSVVVPAGTGTTSLFLARHLAETGARVFAVPCATDALGLSKQMRRLDAASGKRAIFPEILDLPPAAGEAKFRFGTPTLRDWRIWSELRQAGLFIDLIYAPHAWDTLLRALGLPDAHTPTDDVSQENRLNNGPIVYLHCGGLEGVATQLTRYRRAGFPLDEDGDALPSTSASLVEEKR